MRGIVRAPAIQGGVMLPARRDDFELHTGQDASIDHLLHGDTEAKLHSLETFTFLQLTSAAAVAS